MVQKDISRYFIHLEREKMQIIRFVNPFQFSDIDLRYTCIFLSMNHMQQVVTLSIPLRLKKMYITLIHSGYWLCWTRWYQFLEEHQKYGVKCHLKLITVLYFSKLNVNECQFLPSLISTSKLDKIKHDFIDDQEFSFCIYVQYCQCSLNK